MRKNCFFPNVSGLSRFPFLWEEKKKKNTGQANQQEEEEKEEEIEAEGEENFLSSVVSPSH